MAKVRDICRAPAVFRVRFEGEPVEGSLIGTRERYTSEQFQSLLRHVFTPKAPVLQRKVRMDASVTEMPLEYAEEPTGGAYGFGGSLAGFYTVHEEIPVFKLPEFEPHFEELCKKEEARYRQTVGKRLWQSEYEQAFIEFLIAKFGSPEGNEVEKLRETDSWSWLYYPYETDFDKRYKESGLYNECPRVSPYDPPHSFIRGKAPDMIGRYCKGDLEAEGLQDEMVALLLGKAADAIITRLDKSFGPQLGHNKLLDGDDVSLFVYLRDTAKELQARVDNIYKSRPPEYFDLIDMAIDRQTKSAAEITACADLLNQGVPVRAYQLDEDNSKAN